MIDVLLPFYGDPQLMKKAVLSVLDQRSSDWRLIVVDDAYPDPGVAAWFASIQDPRVEYHRNEQNLGANGNYRKALSLATADYVVFMGADDIMLSEYCSALSDAATRFPNASAFHPMVCVVDGRGLPTVTTSDLIKKALMPAPPYPRSIGGESAISGLLRGNWTYFPSICWKTKVIKSIGFRTGLHVVQDMALLVDVFRQGGSLTILPEVSFHYRRHSASDSAVKAATGHRFAEERLYLSAVSRELSAAGMKQASRVARTRLFSRAHALAYLASALRVRDLQAARQLFDHVFG